MLIVAHSLFTCPEGLSHGIRGIRGIRAAQNGTEKKTEREIFTFHISKFTTHSFTQRSSMCLWPLMSDSAFTFVENFS